MKSRFSSREASVGTAKEVAPEPRVQDRTPPGGAGRPRDPSCLLCPVALIPSAASRRNTVEVPAVSMYVLLLLVLEDAFLQHVTTYRARPQLCSVVIFIFTTKSEKLLLETREYVYGPVFIGHRLRPASLTLYFIHTHIMCFLPGVCSA